MYKALEMLERFERENEVAVREDRAKAYSKRCARKRNVKRKITFDWQSQNSTLCALAGALLLALVTIIL